MEESTILSPNERSTSRANGSSRRPGVRLRRLPISRKLLLGYLAFAIPTLVLSVLFDASFATIVRQARSASAGIEYASHVYAVQHEVAALQIDAMSMGGDGAAGATSESPAPPPISMDAMATGALAAVEAAFADLWARHEAEAERLGITDRELAERGLASVAPQRIERLWIDYLDAPSLRTFTGVLDALVRLGSTVLDLSGATRDPSLDTNSMVRSVMVFLPEYSRIVSEVLAFPEGSAGLEAYRTLLDSLARVRIIELAETSLRSDAAWFAARPDVQDAVRLALVEFGVAHGALMATLAAREANDSHDPVLRAAGHVFEASQSLYETGTAGIVATLGDRRSTLLTWRIASGSGSLIVAILVGALLVWIHRTISRSVDGIIDYTRRIADGDYAARLQVDLSDDLAQLYDHTRVMVGEISQLAEFPRQNPNGVMAADRDGAIIYRNPAAQRFLEEHGIGVAELLPENHEAIVRRLLADGVDSQATASETDAVYLEWTYHAIRDAELVHVYFTDVTDRKRAENQLLHDAFHDALSGLPNRALLLDRIEQTLTLAKRERDLTYAVLLLDIDRFKVINESLGHNTGDQVILRIGERLRDLIGNQGTVARLGGDEFAVLLAPIADSRAALSEAQRIHEIVGRTIDLAGQRLSLTASIGIVLPGRDRGDAESILRDADTAMYRAKASGRARSEIFNASMYQAALTALQTEVELTRAIERGEIEPFFQPIVDLREGRIAGFEALARWRHPERGIVAPADFIELAEESGLIVPLGEQVLRRAVELACEWRRARLVDYELMISVNLSVRQFTDPTIVDQIARVIEANDVRPHCLKLEITESGLMRDVDTSMQLLSRLKALEVQLGIDDFGTGYSSLSYLHRFPFDVLKVDQSFVGRMEAEVESREIVTSIVSLAHGLGKVVIAEGIESPGQLTALRALGSEYGQGYLFSRPVPADEAGALLTAGPRW